MSSYSVLPGLRKFVKPVTMMLAALALAACDAIPLPDIVSPRQGGAGFDPAKPVPVALLVPKGSGSASDDLVARNLENAARLAIADLRGVEIDLRVYGTAANPQTAAAQASKAVADGARVIVGPLYAENANAVGVAVANSGVNVLSFTNNTTIAGGNVYALGFTFGNTADRLISYAARNGRGRVVVVHSQDVAGQLGRNAVQSALARSAGSLGGAVDYPLSQQGVVDAIPRIRAAIDNSGANAVFLTSPTASALPLLAQLMPEGGVNPQTVKYIGLTRWDIPPQTLDLPGLAGGWFAVPDPNRSAAFKNRYEATYGSAPHPLAGLAFDGIAAVGALAKKGNISGANLTQGAGFQGATGVFRLRPDGSNQRGLAVATIRDRKVVVIDPAPNGFGGLGL